MRPLILDFAQSLKSNNDEKIPYLYDEDLNLNVIKNSNTMIPFVEINSHKLELMTATARKKETADDDYVQYYLQTETRVKNESVDELPHSLEMITRTDMKKEANDDSFGYELQNTNFGTDESHCLFLSTFTKIRTEENDEDDFNYN